MSINVLEKLNAKQKGTKVVGIATSQGCSPEARYTTNLDQQHGMEESYSIEDSEEHSFTFGHAIKTTLEINFLFGMLSFDVTSSFGHGRSFSKTISSGQTQRRFFSADYIHSTILNVKMVKNTKKILLSRSLPRRTD